MLPNQIGRYKIIDLLGQGGMGQVYKARDPDLNREVALKLIILPDSTGNDLWQQRFRREVQTAGHLNHPHIVTIFDVGLDYEPPYVVMELLTGGTLHERLKQRLFSWQETLTLLCPIVEALDYAHQAGVIHRDVKPVNVMFTADVPKLVDFGLARQQGMESMTQSGLMLGTPAYMSPEQAQGEAVDARTDIFALGIILFEAIAGRNPLDKGSLASTLTETISPNPIDMSPLGSKAPPEVICLIERSVAKDRDLRYPTCKALKADLTRCLNVAGGPTHGIVASRSTLSGSSQSPPLSTPAEPGPQLENPKGLILPAQAETILKIMFNTYQRVIITAGFGGGFSGSRVFLVRPIRSDGQPELPVVIKMAPLGLIEQEWQAYQRCIHRQWPGIAEIKGEPVLPPGSAWGGLCYPMMGGGGTFEIESLYNYFQHASVDDLRHVLEKRLFQITQKTWQFSRPTPELPILSSYDRLLPVNLIIRPVSPPPDITPKLLKPETTPERPLMQGDYVHLEGFMITEVDYESRAVTLNVPGLFDGLPASYRLRMQPIESMDLYQVNNLIVPTEGVVTATRAELLQTEAQHALGQGFDLTGETVTFSLGRTLPNPLVALPGLLDESRDVKIACIHGDLNLENILVDPATRGVRLIDFADARHDHVLHDLLRLETGVVTRLLPRALSQAKLPPQTIRMIYRQLYREVTSTTQRIPLTFPHPALKYPTLRKHFAVLVAIRKMARHQLFKPEDWAEYYQGLTIYLLGTLKFDNLDSTDKQVAFWGAATLVDLMKKSIYLPAIGTAVRPATKPLAKAIMWGRILLGLIPILFVAGLALWLISSNSTPLSTNNFGPKSSETMVATVISVNHQVDVKRKGSDRLISASFGLTLAEGDVVNTYDNATATIICANGYLFSLPEHNNLTMDCQDTSDERFVGQLDPSLSGQLLDTAEAAPVALEPAGTHVSRFEQTQTPLLLSPRNTMVADTRPTFQWQAVPGASGYRLLLNLGSGESWSRETTETSLSYPPNAPPLPPDSVNVVILSTLDDEATVDKTLLRVPDEANLTDLAQAETKIRDLKLDEVAERYLLAQLYQQREMWAAAITQLEQLLPQSSTLPKQEVANLWQQLGNLKTTVALYAQAEDNYKSAIDAAKSNIDPTVEAITHIGLARIARTFSETDQAIEHLIIAEMLYRQAGKIEQAEQVAAERADLE